MDYPNLFSPVTIKGVTFPNRIQRTSMVSGLATEDEFTRVFAPVGLDIGAVTVPEIATSVAAQLIAVRRKGSGCAAPGDMVQR